MGLNLNATYAPARNVQKNMQSGKSCMTKNRRNTGGRIMDEYTYKTYGTARFHIPDGLYSIEEIENLLVYIQAAKKQAEKALERSMKPIKEWNT